MKRRKKFDKIINFGGGPLLLASLALASLGFSSWLVINSPSTSAAGEIEAADIDEKDIFSNVSMTVPFSICKDGMVQDNVILDEGYISVNMTMDISVISRFSYLDENNKFTMMTYLTPSKTAFLDYIFSISVQDIDSTIESQTSTTAKQFSVQFEIDPSLESKDITLVYAIGNENASGESISSLYSVPPTLKFNVEAIRQ